MLIPGRKERVWILEAPELDHNLDAEEQVVNGHTASWAADLHDKEKDVWTQGEVVWGER